MRQVCPKEKLGGVACGDWPRSGAGGQGLSPAFGTSSSFLGADLLFGPGEGLACLGFEVFEVRTRAKHQFLTISLLIGHPIGTYHLVVVQDLPVPKVAS